MRPIIIALVGDHDPLVIAHQAIPRALAIAARAAGADVAWEWVGTDTIGGDPAARLSHAHAVWCVPASPYASMGGALAAIRFARESRRPFLGTCGGSQHALLEYARNVLGLENADHAETNPGAGLPLISEMSCALVEKSDRIRVLEGTMLSRICAAPEIHETYHCRYGLNPSLEHLLAGSTLRICGRDAAGEVRAFELAGHPFFVGTLFQPERSALDNRRHPLIDAFLAAARDGRPA
jgi:CTP synthase (UTP-ammonia lyase)